MATHRRLDRRRDGLCQGRTSQPYLIAESIPIALAERSSPVRWPGNARTSSKKILKFVGIERRVIEQKQLRFFPRCMPVSLFLDLPSVRPPNCGRVRFAVQNRKSVQEVSKQIVAFWVNPRFTWSRQSDSNRRPADYKSAALPAELCRRTKTRIDLTTAAISNRKRHKAITVLESRRVSKTVARDYSRRRV
jgi:hypothetical protein